MNQIIEFAPGIERSLRAAFILIRRTESSHPGSDILFGPPIFVGPWDGLLQLISVPIAG